MAEEKAKMTAVQAAREKYDAAIKAANDALKAKPVDVPAFNRAMADLDEAEKEYAQSAANEMYDEYAKKPNAIVELIKAYSYKILVHKEKRTDDGRVIAVDGVEKERQVDLLAFCKRAKLDADWQYVASKANQLLCLRAAKELGADVKKIATTYYLQDAVKQIELGGTPTSTNQVCKLLQAVIDAVLPNEDEEGKAVWKVNSHDVGYLDMLYGKKDNKNKLTVRVSNDSFFRRILVDICYRLITDGKYGVGGFRTVKA